MFAAGPLTIPVNVQSLVFASVVRWAPLGDTTYYDAMAALYEVRGGCGTSVLVRIKSTGNQSFIASFLSTG
jgi:hypothetical protein